MTKTMNKVISRVKTNDIIIGIYKQCLKDIKYNITPTFVYRNGIRYIHAMGSCLQYKTDTLSNITNPSDFRIVMRMLEEKLSCECYYDDKEKLFIIPVNQEQEIKILNNITKGTFKFKDIVNND